MRLYLFQYFETKLNDFKMENQELSEIKKMLPSGSFQIISNRISNKYTAGTIRQMINGYRKIKPEVLKEAIELLKFINPETKEDYENN